MMIIKQLKAILQHAIKQYDARKGWLRSASPTNFFAQTIANLMRRQIGDPPLIQALRRICAALEPLDQEGSVSQEQLATVVNCFYIRDMHRDMHGDIKQESLSVVTFDSCWRAILKCLSPHLDIHATVGRTVGIFRDNDMLDLLSSEDMATLLQSPEKIDNVYFALCILLDENWDEENLRKTLEMILQFPHQAPNLAGLYLSRPPHLAETLEVLRQNPIQIPNIEFIFADLDQHKLLDLVNTDKILQHPLQAGNIAWILKVLAHHQLLTPANIITMLQQLEQSGHMVKIVEALEHAQSLTPEEIMAILQQDGHETIEMLPDPTQIAHVAQIFQLLQLQGVQLSTRDEENIIKLLDPEQAKNIYEVCKILERAQALNAKNISALLQSPEQTNIMKWAFEILEHAQLLNADHLNALLQSPEKIVEITWILKILQPLQLLNAENIAIVLLPTSKKIDASAWHEMIGIMKFLDRHHYANSKNIIAALHATQPQSRFLLLSTLRKSKDLGAATPKSVANIIQHPVYAKQIENIFNFLRESQLDTPQRKITLLKHPEHSTNIIELINILQRVRLFNPKNLDDILKHIQQSAALQEALQSLEKAEKLSQKTFNNVLSRPKEALFIAKKLGASLDPEMPATRDFMNIRKTAHLLLLAKCASQRQSTATPKYFGKLPPEILFDISDRTGTGALDEDSAIIAARGHYPTPT